MAKKPKFTSAQIKNHIKKIQEAIEKQKRENKSEHFMSITPKEIERKLKRVNSPMIVFEGWGPASPGGTVNYSLGIYNPDATQADSLFAHVWVGSGNVDPTIGTFLLNVDTRFPRLTQPAPFGLTLASGASATLNFTLKVPTAVESTNYIGESCLMRGGWFDTGQYLDRALFVFEVT
jgi:hypothetical protein